MKTCLVVDDSSVIRKVARRILEGLEFQIMEAENGEEAIETCKRQLPDAILLDWNMPKMDGREVLARIKGDPGLKLIPTIILTTSDAGVDISESYLLQANCYLTKPVKLDDFENLVKSITDFWLTMVKLPLQPQTW